MIRMTHPTIGTHVDVPEFAVEEWTAQGWTAPPGVLEEIKALGMPSPMSITRPADVAATLGGDIPPGLANGSVYVAIPPHPSTPRDDVR